MGCNREVTTSELRSLERTLHDMQRREQRLGVTAHNREIKTLSRTRELVRQARRMTQEQSERRLAESRRRAEEGQRRLDEARRSRERQEERRARREAERAQRALSEAQRGEQYRQMSESQREDEESRLNAEILRSYQGRALNGCDPMLLSHAPEERVTVAEGVQCSRNADGALVTEVVLTRQSMERVGSEKQLKPARDVGLPASHERLHTLGPILGVESPHGVLYGPWQVNHLLQQYGIERFLRMARDNVIQANREAGLPLRVVATAHAGLRLHEVVYSFPPTALAPRVEADEFYIRVEGEPGSETVETGTRINGQWERQQYELGSTLTPDGLRHYMDPVE